MASRQNPFAADPADGEGVPVASRFVRALLERHQVPSIRHVTTVAQILNVNYTLIHRRMNGTVAWEVEEIARIAASFGESLGDCFADRAATAEVDAVLVVAGLRVGCKLSVGSALREPERNSLVAAKLGEQWLVLPANEAGVGPCFHVDRMVVTGKPERRWRVAILDDDAVEVANLEEHFSDVGFDVAAFTTVDDLVGHMKARPFDAYILDWVLGEGNAAELVGMIRADDPVCPIAVFTGKIPQDVLVEPAVAGAVSAYRLLFFEKPTRLSIVSAQMMHALAGPGSAG